MHNGDLSGHFVNDTLTKWQTLFLESYVEDQTILEENVSNVKLSSPDVCFVQNCHEFHC